MSDTDNFTIPGILFAVYKPGKGPIRIEWSKTAWDLLDKHDDEGGFADRIIDIAEEMLAAPNRDC